MGKRVGGRAWISNYARSKPVSESNQEQSHLLEFRLKS